MHRNAEPERLAESRDEAAKAPCNCNCGKSTAGDQEQQPESTRAGVDLGVYVDVNG